MRPIRLAASLSIVFLLAAMAADTAKKPSSKAAPAAKVAPAAKASSAGVKQAVKPAAKQAPGRSAAVRRWMRGLTVREEVAQLVFIPFTGRAPNTRSREYRNFVRLVSEVRVGGLILVNWSNGRAIQRAEPYQLAAFLNRMQRIAKVPLMVGGDFERGASMRVEGTTAFPHAMAFAAAGDPAYSRYEGEVTAREARALGVHWIYYPVADVNNNPDNPIINIRSFGENPEVVASHVTAFIEGAHSDKKNFVLATAKHFPGHGDTSVDTHINLTSIPADRERLERLELVPFKAAIAAGADAIMTAHIAVPALAPPDIPATLSPEILTGLLRKELGFNGLVVTDALEMGGIAKGFSAGEAAVRAIEAGADTLLMPSDVDAAIKGVVAAVNSGRIPRKRIQESVAKLLAAKERVGLSRTRVVGLEDMEDVLNPPEAAEKAQEIADRAVTLVRNNGGALPLSAPEKACYVVMQESRSSNSGQVFTQELKNRHANARVATIDPTMPRPLLDETMAKLGACDSYAVAAFATVGAYRNSVGLAGDLPAVMQTMTGSGKPVVLVALGNPYLLRNFPEVTAYLATFSSVPVSELAALKAILGEMPIRGRLPITIPGLANYGDGIQLPGRVN